MCRLPRIPKVQASSREVAGDDTKSMQTWARCDPSPSRAKHPAEYREGKVIGGEKVVGRLHGSKCRHPHARVNECAAMGGRDYGAIQWGREGSWLDPMKAAEWTSAIIALLVTG